VDFEKYQQVLLQSEMLKLEPKAAPSNCCEQDICVGKYFVCGVMNL
jgi:hypothetical protein